jgi:acetyl-CoA C-acetyltransferase
VTVHVLGGCQTDFAARADGLYPLVEEAVLGALEATGVPASDVEVAHVGNLAGELFGGQAQLGGFVNTALPALAEVPTARHEAACASGSVAVLAAMAELAAGRYDLALVTGVELMRNVGGKVAAEHLGAAAWVGREATDAAFPWPHLFGVIADEYAHRWGLDHAHLGRIAELNLGNARRNPRAQARDWTFPPGAFGTDDALNPVVDGRLRKQDCGRITDGAAAVLLASDAYLRRSGRESAARITGWGHRGAPMLLADKLARAEPGGYLFPHLRRAVTDAYGRAGIDGPADLDVVELHDCFTITEYAALDHLGITPPGQGWRAIESGVIEPGGALPVNPSGGLIGAGHPVGATGVRMLLDAYRQVTGGAGEYQVDAARRAATLNVGGSFTTAVTFVVES